jgi:glutamate racemase
MAKAIGVFDSGIGGLTVAAAIKRQFPNRKIIYFGDTVHLPYGDKSAGQIQKYIKAISAFLFAQDCDQLVVACNSASSVLEDVVTELPSFNRVLNVIDPVVDSIVQQSHLKRIGVIGTKRTIDSNVYEDRLKAKKPELEVFQLATPLLAPMIEEGFVHDKIAASVIDEYLSEMPSVDALILGCTHYPLIRKEINDFYKGKVELLEAPELIAQSMNANASKSRSEQQEDLVYPKLQAKVDGVHPKLRAKVDHFYVSDYTASFEQTAQQFFGSKIKLEKRNLFD